MQRNPNLKIARIDGDQEVPLIYGKKWITKRYPNIDAIQVAVDQDQVDLMVKFTRCLKPPFYVLYVLLVSRCDNEIGRYESDPFYGFDEVEIFLKKYRTFFEKDGRHNVWVGEIEGKGLLVYDNHNRMFAYGDIADYIEVLNEEGYSEDEFSIGCPHSHHYNKQFDEDERSILAEKEWHRLPLQDSDDE